MKVEFDIKYRPQIESGEYQVETNNGRKVRIICWDAVAPDREQDIIALVTNSYGDSENILRYYNNGKLISDSASVGGKDLCVIIPVKCNVGDWIKYNGNVYVVTSIDNSGYKVTLLDGDEENACTAISFTAADNMARLVKKPEFNYFQESLAYSLNCEFMGVTLDECEYFAAKYGKELEDAVLKEHPVFEPEQEWSEEDEAHRTFILESLEDQIRFCKKDAEGAYYAKQIRTAQNWLKSRRPQPHTVSIKNANKFAELEYERGVKDGIQSEKSHHWKPSKEQMGALFNASERNDRQGHELHSLYYDLKKQYELEMREDGE